MSPYFRTEKWDCVLSCPEGYYGNQLMNVCEKCPKMIYDPIVSEFVPYKDCPAGTTMECGLYFYKA